jgi:hypothetical protein
MYVIWIDLAGLSACRELLFSAAVVAVGWEHDQSPVDWERLQLNTESQSLFVRKRRADLGPAFTCFAVAFELLDGKGDVRRKRGWNPADGT